MERGGPKATRGLLPYLIPIKMRVRIVTAAATAATRAKGAQSRRRNM